jgi:hypothetical protein
MQIRVNCLAKDIGVLKNAIGSVLEHHFRNKNKHSICREWCNKLRKLVGQEREHVILECWPKQKNAFFYLQVKALFDQFYMLLDEMLHEQWDTNIKEGMHNCFTKFFTKD